MCSADAPTGSSGAADEAAEALSAPTAGHTPGGVSGHGEDAPFAGRFDRWYGPLVGLARRILDPSAATTASLVSAEQIVVDAFVARRFTIGADEPSDVAHLVGDVAEHCLDAMVGHPGTVPLHYEILGPDIDFDGELPLAELQGALNGMRRWDRRVGVLALAAGLSPSQVATLLRRPLDEVIDRVARVCTRLADGRRIGLTDDLQAGVG